MTKDKLVKILVCIVLFFVLCLSLNDDTLHDVKVIDGDTIRVENKSIRLAGIDCFEIQNRQRVYKQAYENKISTEEAIAIGQKSKKLLEDLIDKNKNHISFKKTGVDMYERDLGIVYANKINVNQFMLDEGGCVSYGEDVKEDKNSFGFVFWFSLFVVLAWYQLVYWNKFKGNHLFYNMLTYYCLLNLVWVCVLFFEGFKVVGGWFVFWLILGVVLVQSALAIIENVFFKGHSASKLSFVGVFLIPISIWYIWGGIWIFGYVLALMFCFLPMLNSILKNKKGKE